jgi:hypothetical protein
MAGAHVLGPDRRDSWGCRRPSRVGRYLYVRDGVVSTVPCTSCVAAACRGDLVSDVVFSRVVGAWPMVARV